MNYVYLSIFLGVALLIVTVLLVMCYNTPRQMTNDQLRNQITTDLNTKQFPNLTKDNVSKLAKCMIKNFPTLTQVVNNNPTLHTLFVNIISDKQCRGRFPAIMPHESANASSPSPSPSPPPPVCEKYFANASFIEQSLILEYLTAIGAASNMTGCEIN